MLLVHFKSATDHWEQERRGLARASLSASHEITTGDCNGDSVLLHGSGLRVPHLFNAMTDGV